MGWRGVLAQRTPPLRAAAKRRSQAGGGVRRGAATRSLRSARGAAHSEAARIWMWRTQSSWACWVLKARVLWRFRLGDRRKVDHLRRTSYTG
jgi:hypothetical protein